MKKAVAAVLSIISLITSILPLGGCLTESSPTLTVGQWLGMINSAFGMESYTNEEPYISSIGKDDEYFNTIQIASEWEVIDTDSSINPRDTLVWKDTLITLVNAGGFTSIDAAEDEKIEFAIDNFDSKIRKYWMNREIDVSTATNLLIKAQELWADRTYSTPIEKVKYSDDVIDLSTIQPGVIDYYVENETVVFLDEEFEKLSKDDIFVLPADNKSTTSKAYKVEDVIKQDGKVFVKTDDELELGDFVDELYIENTTQLDLSQAEIYDGNGNLVQAGSEAVPQSYYSYGETPQITTLAYSTENYEVMPLVGTKSFSFKTEECEVSVKIKDDGISADVEIPFSETISGVFEVEVSDFEITNKIDYSWFTLHSAEVKVDYKTKTSGGVKAEFVEEEAVYAPKWSNGNGKFLTNLKNSVWKNKSTATGAKTIKLAKIQVASVGVASFSVDVYAKFSVDGSVEIICTETGCKGIEYKNGNCRVINTSNKDTDVKFKAKAEATVSVSPTVNAFGFAIIGVKAELGLGGEVSITMHLADTENHLFEEMTSADIPPEVYEATSVQGLTADVEEVKKLAESQGGTYEKETSGPVDLHLDICTDINIYFILKVGLEEETLAGKLLKGTSVKVEWEIFGSDNAKICNIHIENFEFNIDFFTADDICTKKYVPFDNGEEEQEEQEDETDVTESNSINVGEVLTISTMKVVLNVDEKTTISVAQIPKGYELKDIICKSSDDKIVTIDKNGVIVGKSEGSATIIVSTSDGKYSCACSVTVVSEETDEFTPLSGINDI